MPDRALCAGLGSAPAPVVLDRKTVHDLLTPLNAIVGFSGILLQKTKDVLDAKQTANLQRILDSGKQLVAMIRALGESPPSVGSAAPPLVTTALPASDVEKTPISSPAIVGARGGSKILVVDDVGSNRELLRQELGDAGFEVTSQASGFGGLETARSFDPALIILDIDMPGMDGIETCRRLKQDPITAHIPVLFLTGQHDEETAVAALAAGGNDFLQKPYSPSILLARVSSQVAIYEGNARLRHMVMTDALTGLYSRRFLFESVRQQMKQLSRSGTPVLSCIMIDVDHFKSINDKLGHLEGDKVLKRIAELLRIAIRGGDIAARFGGEEFLVVLPATLMPGAATVAEKVRGTVEDGTRDGTPATISLGVASVQVPRDFPKHRDEGVEFDRLADDLFRRADEALYRAKRAGRNRVARDGEGDT